jgi:hypothetical protein
MSFLSIFQHIASRRENLHEQHESIIVFLGVLLRVSTTGNLSSFYLLRSYRRYMCVIRENIFLVFHYPSFLYIKQRVLQIQR